MNSISLWAELIDPFFSFLVSSGVVSSTEIRPAKHPGAIPKKRPSTPPQSSDGEEIWVKQTLIIDPVLALEDNVNVHKQVVDTSGGSGSRLDLAPDADILALFGEYPGLRVPLNSTPQMLRNQGVVARERRLKKNGDTSRVRGMCNTHHCLEVSTVFITKGLSCGKILVFS